MKRLLLRIAALAAVVVLGFIAIAQAQRSAEEQAATTTTSAAPRSDDAPAQLPSGVQASPLQGDGERAAPIRPRPAFRIRPVAHQEDSPALAAPRTESSAAPRPLDPFGLSARQGTGPSSATSPSAGDKSSDIPPASALEVPAEPANVPPAGAANAGAAGSPAQQSRLGPVAAAGPSLDGAGQPEPNRDRMPGDRYSNRRFAAAQAAGSTTDEPAPFKADPLAAPTSPALAGSASSKPALAPAADAAMPQDPSAANEATGQPGGKQLEGPQSPQVTIEKSGPKEIQVGKPATFKTTVRNTGQIPAVGIEVRDLVPKGTRLLGTVPKATRSVRGELIWVLGTLKPGEDASAEMELMPVSEGEIGSVATVHVNAEATARATVTKPDLVVQVSAPGQVLIGEEAAMTITVSNTGTGVATGVVIEEHIPAGLQHSSGADLEYEVGELAPGASKQLELALTAAKPGPVTNVLKVRGDGSLKAEHRFNMEVLAPQLDIAVGGPKRRYLEREASYEFTVSNPGTAAAKQVELVAYLPPALKFVSANNAGHYFEADRTVHWRLEQLPSKESGAVQLVTVPIEPGQQKLRLRGTAQRGLEVEREQPILIDGISAILFQAADTVDPVEVGKETTYEIRVVNQGSKAATNVRITVMLPPELKFVAAEGPSRYNIDGNQVVFEGLARLAPKADTTYQVRAQGLRPGDLRTRIQLMTDEMQTPVTKEESTRVYADE